MDIRFVMTPEGAGKKADEEAAKRACSYFRMDDMPVNPVLAFSFLEDRDWLNDYHRQCYEKLSPFMTDEENAWLREYTRAV
jgi:hypothetical protein